MKTNLATVTISDTRTAATDTGGATLRTLLSEAGMNLAPHVIVSDDMHAIRKCVSEVLKDKSVAAVVVSGGTGIGPRDVTIEALEPMFDKRLDGFGEAFRRLSWDEVGTRALLSRACAGVLDGRLLFVLPGSPSGVRLATTHLILPMLPHALSMMQGGGHAEGPHQHGHG